VSVDINEAEVFRLTPEEAAQYLTESAFEVTDPESEDFGRKIVHSYADGLGADWDLQDVLGLLDEARDIAWLPGPFTLGHDLAVLTAEGRKLRFDVKAPAEVPR
jgi:hypothetical protein